MRLLNKIKKTMKFTNKKNQTNYCPICKNESKFLPFGVNPRDNAQCPNCESLERHRFLYLFFKQSNLLNNNIKLLHFAPEPVFYKIFNECENVDYYPVDIKKEEHLKEQVDMQDIPYENDTFNIIYNSHVLEHVPDDIKAMKELYRTVKPKNLGGAVIIMVPVKDLDETFENEEYNTPELRLKHYGQHDHVRIYGRDFTKRLEAVGFNVKIITDVDLITRSLINKYKLADNDEIYLCTK